MRLAGLVLVAGLAFASPVAAEEAAATLVADLATCLGGSMPEQVVVAGLPRDQTALGSAEAERLRLEVEVMLKAAGAGIAAAGDVERLRGLLETVRDVSGPETEALIETAHTGDAVVFVVEPVRGDDQISFRLQAITPDAACKVTSARIETALADGGAGAIDRVLALGLKGFFDASPGAESLGICPVVSEAGYSACAPALADSLAAVALAEAASPNRTLSGRTLEVTRMSRAECLADTGVPAALARLSTDVAGATWLDLEVRQGTRTLATLPRTKVDVAALGCDPTPRPLLDYVSLTMNRDAGVLDITAPPFATGQLLDVEIRLARAATLHCWIIAPDETAFVLLPIGDMADRAPGTYSYPEDFGLQSVVLGQPFENLFHCFAPAGPLPDALAGLWQAAVSGDGGPTLLDSQALTELLAEMRAQPGMVEAATRIIVR